MNMLIPTIKRRLSVLAVAFTLLFSHRAFAQEDLSVLNYWKYYDNDPAKSLYKLLCNRAFEQIDKREVAIAQLKTKADWQKRQAEIRTKLKNIIGVFPDKTPLSPVITGKVKREDLTVEKLYFQSRPGFYVTAALFLPNKLKKRAPAILYCSGHSPVGFRSDVYQHVILNYVKKGFVVLAFDPIGQGERLQYLDHPTKISGTSEHSYAGAQNFITGISPANYFIWDGIRAIDYLISRKEVDPARIGITGRSGGGTQTAYIAAVDDRILASAPENYITTFDKLLRSNGPQDGEQNLLHSLEQGIDMPDYLTVRAPKPTLMVTTTRDIFSIQGARDAYQEVKKAYQALGQAGNLNMVEDDAAHASTPKNRVASYAFFQKYLNNPGSSEDLEVKIFTEQELQVTPKGQIYQTLNGETVFSLNQKYSKSLTDKREQNRKNDTDYLKNFREKIISTIGYEKPTSKNNSIFSGRIHRPNYAIEKYLVKGSGDYYLPVLWLKPKTSSGKLVLLFDERGKASAVQAGELADQLASKGFEVVLPDLSGIGELGNGFIKGGDSVIEEIPLNLWFAGILTHKSLVAIRAAEINILADFVKNNAPQLKSLTASAVGILTSDLLHTAVISNPFEQIVMLNPLVSYLSITSEKQYKAKYVMSAVADVLKSYDLPDLVALLAKNKVLLVNPVNAAEKVISKEVADTAYKDALRTQTEDGNVSIKHAINPVNYSVVLNDWIK